MKFARRDIAALAAAVLLGGPAAGQAPWPETAFNRQSAEGDLVLPAPCGGSVVFRPVDVPGSGPYDDRKITIGGRDPSRAFVENARAAFVGGTFKTEGGWRFYIGKYEVTAAQHAALNGDCVDAGDPETSLPEVEVTPAEAMLAAERYTEWLFANAPDALPGEAGAPGFARLPTEEEWEYAARGGVAVGPAEFEARLPPMSGPPERSIVFCRTDCALELVGLLDPNPLGLHDMHGNAAELVQGLFRLNRVERENGSAGGFVKRGGDFRTKLDRIHSGLREEFAPLGRSALRREPTTGYRLALAAPVLPDRQRLEEARDSWGGLAETEARSIGSENADPREEIKTLADYVEQLGRDDMAELNRRLLALSDVIDVNISTRNQERARAAREMLRVAVFAALRLPEHLASVERCEELVKLDADRYRDRCEKVIEDSQFDSDFYIDHLVRTKDEFPYRILTDQIDALEGEFGSRFALARDCVAVVATHLRLLNERGVDARDVILAPSSRGCAS
ncbi:MAG: SUMF1/EgtB/PvdO family nonheme iron enzyme [Pseudomonadota bacterium]